MTNAVCNWQVNVLKPSHLSTLQSNIVEKQADDSVSALHNISYDGNIKEIAMDYVKLNIKVIVH